MTEPAAVPLDPGEEPRVRRPSRGGGRLRNSRWKRPISPPAMLAMLDGYRIALAIVLAAAFGLRLWGIKQGLPYSYNSDEAAHFLPRAVAFFSHDYNPGYFLNPPAYSYLLHIVLELWYGSGDAVTRSYAHNPAGVFIVARVIAAVLGTIAVWLTYLAGVRLFDRTVALVAAAIFAVAFLPSFYSHLALNDVPTLAPVSLALYGVAGILNGGARKEYVCAGIGIGLAAATKYTGAIMLVCLVCAAGLDALWGGDPVRPARRLALASVIALVAFIVANPYSVLDFPLFIHDVSKQQSLAAGSEPEKLGTTAASGTSFYVWLLTWGLGWVPAVAALGGAARLVIRRRVALAVVLVPAPIAFLIFMGDQQRFFGRWLLPIFPILVLLAGSGAVALVRWLVNVRRVPAPVVVTVATIALLGQGLATTIHDDRVLSRPDTRNTTRTWMVAHIPAGSKVVVEPVVSSAWSTDTDPPDRSAGTTTGARWRLWNTYWSTMNNDGKLLPPGQHRYVALDQYERTLWPGLIGRYEQAGYCWVVISSLQAGRSFAQPKVAPQALQYYAALANDAKLVYHITPFSSSKRAVPFSFDWSIDYYPSQYRRPGPEMSVYRLVQGRCATGG